MSKRKRQAGESIDTAKLDKIVADSRRAIDKRQSGYREQSLKLHPWICGRCAREFTRKNLQELTVHHIDHNHDNNPSDGSNWENLCLYCHDNEHQKFVDKIRGFQSIETTSAKPTTFNPFAGLGDMMDKDN
ncbi:MAG: YajD family HNH nuclease [Thiohalomonadales bacterium]